MSRKFRPAALAAALAAVLGSGFSASPADAGVLVASAPGCDNGAGAQVFARWGDSTNYFLAADGGFESRAAGWSLSGASVGAGNEAYDLAAGANHLDLPSGSSATSATECVGLEHPTMRFVVRKTAGSLLANLRVDVRFEDALGIEHALPVGLVGGSSAWQPSPVLVVGANLLALLPGEHTPVRFTFTPQGGSWQVDDVFIDPRGGH